ncbi:MAG: site-2 protease family protein [Lishizhenia sp.]
MEEFESFYPPKPKLVEKERKGHIAVTLLSVLLFILSFSLLVTDNYTFIFILVGVLLIHELGHFLLMKAYGYSNVRMLFVPLMGAFVHGKKEVYSQRQSALVLFAGPLPGILLGLGLLYFGDPNAEWVLEAGLLLLFLNVLNLVPIDPLDGGQLLKVLFLGKQELFQLIFALISSLALIALGWWLQAWLIVGFGFLLGLRVRSIHKLYLVRRELELEDLKYESVYADLSDKNFAGIKRVILENSPALQTFQEQAPEEKFNEIIASQVNGVLMSPTQRDASFLFKAFSLLVWIAAIGVSIYVVFNLDLSFLANNEF